MNLNDLLVNRTTAMLEWVEPLYGATPDGKEIVGNTTLRATVADCIAASRLQYQHNLLRDARVSDETLLLDFVAVHWAECRVTTDMLPVAPDLGERDIPTRWRRWVGWWRVRWGYCPACNFDAPEIDTCKICAPFSWAKSRRAYPMRGDALELMYKRFKLGYLKHDTTNYRPSPDSRTQD